MHKKKIDVIGVYTGDIYLVDKKSEYEKTRYGIRIHDCISSLYKKGAYLLKLCEHGYVDIETIRNYYYYLCLKNYMFGDGTFKLSGNVILSDLKRVLDKGCLFVHPDSIQEEDIGISPQDIGYDEIKQFKLKLSEKRGI